MDIFDEASLISAGYRLMRHDPFTGRKVYVLIEGTKLHVKEFADVEPLLNQNKEIRAMTAGTGYGDGAIVARIPEHILHGVLAEPMRQGDKGYLDRWLNDSDHSKFRVRDGRI
jgi:hypothetical protein